MCLKACCFHNNLSLVAVWRLPQPHLTDLDVLSAKQMLLVSWLVNRTSLLGATSELQISRTENHTIVYSVSPEGLTLFFRTLNKSNMINSLIVPICLTLLNQRNISVLNLGKNVWTWTSDLPLECVDHSVRMRYLYNQTVQSSWSNWKTNSGELMQL